MMLSILAILILAGSTILIVSNLRMVMRDIFEVLRTSVSEYRLADHMAANVAFVALWMMIFVLSFS